MNPRFAILGSGTIAKCHAYAIMSQRFFCASDKAPSIRYVASPTESRRTVFAKQNGVAEALPPDELWLRDDYDSLVIAGPNRTHFEHLDRAARCEHIRRIYIEKPVCCSQNELNAIIDLQTATLAEKTVHVGFQFMHYSGLRSALGFLQRNELGRPLHFRIEYLHSGYLKKSYRVQRQERLMPWPKGGALADLGSHGFSLAIAAFGNALIVDSAMRSGAFDDVPHNSDLCTQVSIRDLDSGAFGTIVASRVSAGAADDLMIEVRCESGAIKFASTCPDSFWLNQTGRQGWILERPASDYRPNSVFPTPTAAAGFLRPLIHAHYLFMSDNAGNEFVADLNHGIAVQKLLLAAYLRLS